MIEEKIKKNCDDFIKNKLDTFKELPLSTVSDVSSVLSELEALKKICTTFHADIKGDLINLVEAQIEKTCKAFVTYKRDQCVSATTIDAKSAKINELTTELSSLDGTKNYLDPLRQQLEQLKNNQQNVLETLKRNKRNDGYKRRIAEQVNLIETPGSSKDAKKIEQLARKAIHLVTIGKELNDITGLEEISPETTTVLEAAKTKQQAALTTTKETITQSINDIVDAQPAREPVDPDNPQLQTLQHINSAIEKRGQLEVLRGIIQPSPDLDDIKNNINEQIERIDQQITQNKTILKSQFENNKKILEEKLKSYTDLIKTYNKYACIGFSVKPEHTPTTFEEQIYKLQLTDQTESQEIITLLDTCRSITETINGLIKEQQKNSKEYQTAYQELLANQTALQNVLSPIILRPIKSEEELTSPPYTDLQLCSILVSQKDTLNSELTKNAVRFGSFLQVADIPQFTLEPTAENIDFPKTINKDNYLSNKKKINDKLIKILNTRIQDLKGNHYLDERQLLTDLGTSGSTAEDFITQAFIKYFQASYPLQNDPSDLADWQRYLTEKLNNDHPELVDTINSLHPPTQDLDQSTFKRLFEFTIETKKEFLD